MHLVKDSKQSERLGDLAQVLPKGGRSLMILVGEKDVSFFISFFFHKVVYRTWEKCWGQRGKFGLLTG